MEAMDPARIDMAYTNIQPLNSHASAQPDEMERFTAIGRPMGHSPSVTLGDAWGGTTGGFGAFALPTHLPIRFTDESIISVPIRLSDLQDPEEEFDAWWSSANKESKTRKKSFKNLAKSLLLRDRLGAKKGEFMLVRMTRGDYLKYCAKDERGKYIGTEPQGRSRQALREMVSRQRSERSNSLATAVDYRDDGVSSPVSSSGPSLGRRVTLG